MGVSRKAVHKILGTFGAVAVILGVAVPLITVSPASAASTYSINQCRNGKLGSPATCDNQSGTYQTGDLGSENSHFREGDFVPFNLIVSSLTAGSHDVQIQYQVTDSNKHAYDYLGSYDTTETVGTSPNPLFAGDNNPCDGITLSTPCVPGANFVTSPSGPGPGVATTTAAPNAQIPITAPDFAGSDSTACGGSGTFKGPQVAGDFKMFGAPIGSSLDKFSYVTQNSGSGGGCVTIVEVDFTLSADQAGNDLVFAWGGHIASQIDWGNGNSASFISGAPYHMWINNLDGSGGAQERSLKTTAVFFTPSITTNVVLASDGTTQVTSVNGGTAVEDSAVITGASGNEGGTVTYNLYNNATCTPGAGTPPANLVQTSTVTVNNGVVPNSTPPFTTPIGGGSFCYQATYNGDGGSNLASAPGPIEPFSVNAVQPMLGTQIYQVTPTGPVSLGTSTSVGLGTQVQDLVNVSGGNSPTGNVTYTFFTGNTTCNTGTGVSAGTTPIGSPSYSDIELPTGGLAAGSYSFQASYPGDSKNLPATSPCEPLTVNKGTLTIDTTPLLKGTTSPSIENTAITLGSQVYDTATLGGQVSGFPVSGSVVYTLYEGTCTPGATPAGTVIGSPITVAVNSSGQVPPSSSVGFSPALQAGSYFYVAQYTDDANYNPTSLIDTCEPFTVNPAPLTVNTVPEDAANNPISASDVTGTTVHDTATLSGILGGIEPSGTLTYHFFNNGTCAGTGTTEGAFVLSSSTVPPSNSVGPLGAGNYAFDVTYAGDPNYDSINATQAAASCEPFTISPTTLGINTVPEDAANNPISASDVTGTTVHDTATLTLTAGILPSGTGTLTYHFFTNGSCTGTGTAEGSFLLTSATVPNSNPVGPLGGGSYAFDVTYTGDANYNPITAAQAAMNCEPFTIGPTTLGVNTVPEDAANNPISSADLTGTVVHDTATLTLTAGILPAGGTLTYHFFNNGSCTGTGSTAGSFVLTSATVPNSNTEGPLATGNYSFDVTYTGDANYSPITASQAAANCEPFSIGKTPTNTVTVVMDGSGPVTAPVALGDEVFDTATVTPQDPAFVTTGTTVTYNLYMGACGDTTHLISTQTVDVSTTDGSVPNSNTTAPLGAGSYYYSVTYSGNSNYGTSSDVCEPFTVNPAPLSFTTVPKDAAGNPISSADLTGTTAHDTATLSGILGGIEPSGTLTYHFFTNGTCTGSGTTEGAFVLSSSTVPNSGPVGPLGAGSYSFDVTYAGDPNYDSITAAQAAANGCEPFTITPAPLSFTTVPEDAAGNPISSADLTGTTAHDTATLSGILGSIEPSGTLTYHFFTNGTCDGTGTTDGSFVLSSATVPDSSPAEGPLGAGSYSFDVTYAGDPNYDSITASQAAANGCEPFTIAPAPLSFTTVPKDAAGNPISSADVTGTTVHDTATLSGILGGIEPSGTLTYHFFTNGTCDGTGTTDGSFVLSSATVPDSSPAEGPLGAGSYSFDVTYAGDPNYDSITASQAAANGCEPFTIGPATPTLSTTMTTPASSNLGNSWNDTATVTGVSTFAPAGDVRFQLCQETTSSPCTGGSLVDVTLNAPTQTNGDVSTYALPSSDAFTPTAVGTYCYNVSYAAGNDPNYVPVSEQSDVECFLVTNPDFKVVKTDVPGDGNPVQPGSTIPYTVTISNIGDGAGTVTVTDTLPSNLTIVNPPPVCSVSGCVVTNTTGSTWTFTMNLAASGSSGDSGTVTFSAQVAATDTADVVNTATITTGPCDNGLTTTPSFRSHAAVNNCSSTVTNPVPDFTVTKTDGPGSNTAVAAGSTIPYTVAIKNVGDGGGTAVITDALPSQLTLASSPAPSCSATAPDTCTVGGSGSTLTFSVSLAAGNTATATFSAVVAATATGTITNTATITTGPCNTASGCSSTVSNPIPPATAPAVAPTTTTTTAPPVIAPVIAFTGADIAAMAAGGAALLGLGSFLVLLSRRRRRAGESG